MKHIFKKVFLDSPDLHLAVLNLRNTRVSGLEYALTQFFMGGLLCSFLQAASAALTPRLPSAVLQKLNALQC